MRTGQYMLRVQTGQRSFYADVTVSVAPAAASTVVFARGVFDWLEEVYGRDAWKPVPGNEFTTAAQFGAKYALSHLEQQQGGIHVEVLKIRFHPAHSDFGCVALAACYATWRALGDAGVGHPRVEAT